jgi:hypothetical protein
LTVSLSAEAFAKPPEPVRRRWLYGRTLAAKIRRLFLRLRRKLAIIDSGAAQLLLGHTKIESNVRYLAIEADDALAIADQADI